MKHVIITSITDAIAAIDDFRMEKASAFDDETRAKLREVANQPSPVDSIVSTLEMLYARSDELDADGKALVAALAGFASQNGWHGLPGERGAGIITAMGRRGNRRDTDPSVDPAYAAVVASDAKLPNLNLEDGHVPQKG